eukprot:c32037_g1_i1 orf=138-320(+)
MRYLNTMEGSQKLLSSIPDEQSDTGLICFVSILISCHLYFAIQNCNLCQGRNKYRIWQES